MRLYEPPHPPPEELRRAELLLVRSVTPVDAALLEGSAVRIVGTASAGADHLDREALHAAGIRTLSASGCNARAVAEYTVAALCALTRHLGRGLAGMQAGIIGCGRIGGRVAEWLGLLGVRCIRNDPPLQERNPDGGYASLEAALQADIVSLHVPCTVDGPYPTHGLLGPGRLQRLRPGAILVNTARGQVLDEHALLERLRRGRLHAVIDTWRHEPAIDRALAAYADLATPHVAGYSRRGRERAARLLYRQLCGSGREPGEPPAHVQSLPRPPGADAPAATILSACDPRPVAAALRALARDPGSDLAAGFTRLRACYPLRREFPEYRLQWDPGPLPLRRLGFAAATV